MEELIFFAVIIFFSIIESIARSRKAKKGGEADGPLPDSGDWEARFPDLEAGRSSIPGERELEAYDDEVSYDEILEEQRIEQRQARDGESMERYTRPRGTSQPTGPSPSRPRPASRPSSETMLPGDLLEQLEALARGATVERDEARTIELPKQSPPLPAPIERTEVGTGHGSTDPLGTLSPYGEGSRGPVGSTAPIGSRSPVGSRSPIEGAVTRRPDHFVHRSHAGYGTDPSSRAPSEQDGLDPLAEFLDADGVAVRAQLFGGRAALRQAFVLREVLGPPKALRENDSVF